MTRVLTREGLLLLSANLLVVLIFLVVYQPVPNGYEDGFKMRHGQVVFEFNSADPQLFAGRELHWHTGESMAARWFVWLNLPAVLSCVGLSIAVSSWLARLSAVERSWVQFVFFLVFVVAQWPLVGWALRVAFRRRAQKHGVA